MTTSDRVPAPLCDRDGLKEQMGARNYYHWQFAMTTCNGYGLKGSAFSCKRSICQVVAITIL